MGRNFKSIMKNLIKNLIIKKEDIALWQPFQDRKQHPERCPYGIMCFDDETGKIMMYRDINLEQQWINGKI